MLPGFRAGRHVANLDATKAARTTLKQSALFDLPVKVRKEIYRLCVPSGFVFDVREYNTFRGSPKISATPEALLDRSRWYFEGPSLDDSDHEWDSDDEGSAGESGDESEEDDEYSGIIRKDTWIDAAVRRPGWLPEIRSLLVTSQQIREEVLDVLYGENVFRVILGPQSSARSLEASFSEAKMRRIRHIMVVYKQFGTFADYIPECRIPTFIWQGVIPNLTTLHIVFEQPTGDYFEHFWPCRSNVANQMKLWLEEVPPLLEGLGELLPPSATVLVDIDEKKVTTDLLDKHLGREWTTVRTMTGDTLFRKRSTRRERFDWMDQTFAHVPAEDECDCVPWDERSENYGSDWETESSEKTDGAARRRE